MDSESNSDSDLAPTQLVGSQIPRCVVGPNTHVYDKLILFQWRPKSKTPFNLFKKEDFFENEIRDVWLRYQMVHMSRHRKLKSAKNFPGLTLSLFAKVEDGIL